METHLYRTATGWVAKSIVDLGNGRVLTLTTARAPNTGGLVSRASVARVCNGLSTHVVGSGGTGDFHREISRSNPVRVTEQVVCGQHERVLADLMKILLAVELHYQAQQAPHVEHSERTIELNRAGVLRCP
jgi:hypothetical protein